MTDIIECKMTKEESEECRKVIGEYMIWEGLDSFIRESKKIEGLYHEPKKEEIESYKKFLSAEKLSVDNVTEFVKEISGAELRDREDMNVRIGKYKPHKGGPIIKTYLSTILDSINADEITPFQAHNELEALHAFTDGNGRSGRAIWLWHMAKHKKVTWQDLMVLGVTFLQQYYYQSLNEWRNQR